MGLVKTIHKDGVVTYTNMFTIALGGTDTFFPLDACAQLLQQEGYETAEIASPQEKRCMACRRQPFSKLFLGQKNTGLRLIIAAVAHTEQEALTDIHTFFNNYGITPLSFSSEEELDAIYKEFNNAYAKIRNQARDLPLRERFEIMTYTGIIGHKFSDKTTLKKR